MLSRECMHTQVNKMWDVYTYMILLHVTSSHIIKKH